LVVKTTVVAWHGGKSREVRKKVKGEFGDGNVLVRRRGEFRV